jgi:hypothetical protein
MKPHSRLYIIILILVLLALLAFPGWFIGLYPPYKSVAKVAANISFPYLCATVTPVAWDGNYRKMCYGEVARLMEDTWACDIGYKQGISRASCYKEVLAETKQLSDCEKLDASGTQRCYESVLREIHNQTSSPIYLDAPYYEVETLTIHCENIFDAEAAATCEAFDGGKDPSICQGINSTKLSMYCYEAIAKNTLQVGICNKLQPSYKSGCVTDIAIAKKDSELCLELEAASRDHCFNKMALATGEKILCVKIENQHSRDKCLRAMDARQ